MSPAGLGLLMNVSENGIGVYPLTNLGLGQEVLVSFMIPDSADRVECTGSVKWMAEHHVGLQLRHSDTSGFILRQWVSTLPLPEAVSKSRAQRRKFPLRDDQLKAIKSHIAEEKLKIGDALPFIVVRLLDLVEANGVAIAIGEAGEMVCRASAGLAPPEGAPIGSNSGLTGECIRTGKTIYCEDAYVDSRVDRETREQLRLRSLLIVPVLYGEAVGGVVEVFSPRRSAFPEDYQWLVKEIAELTAELSESERKVVPKPIKVEASETEAAGAGRKRLNSIEMPELASIGDPVLEESEEGNWKRIGVAGLLVAALILIVWLLWH